MYCTSTMSPLVYLTSFAVLFCVIKSAPVSMTEEERKAAFNALYSYGGDIKLTPRQKALTKTRNAVPNFSQKWSNGVIPYEIDTGILSITQSLIQIAVDHIKLMTNGCIKFVKRTTEQDYVAIIPGTKGCWSWIGKTGGRQELHLGTGCGWIGIVIHELLHVVGFAHEHNRPDRDYYVTVNYTNVKTDQSYNFNKLNNGIIYASYDYDSIMHYGSYAFTSNGQMTIVPVYSWFTLREPYEKSSMTYWDGYEVMRYYNCI